MRHKNLETIARLHSFLALLRSITYRPSGPIWISFLYTFLLFSDCRCCKPALGDVGVVSGILCLYVFTLWFTHLYRYTFKKPIIGTRTLTRHVPGASFTTQKTHTCMSQGRKADTPENERSRTTLFSFITRCREMYNISNIYKYKISINWCYIGLNAKW